MPKKAKTPEIDFEASLSELDLLVNKMENETLSLEESLACFEKGVSLTKDCQKILSAAEQKVKTLMVNEDKQ